MAARRLYSREFKLEAVKTGSSAKRSSRSSEDAKGGEAQDEARHSHKPRPTSRRNRREVRLYGEATRAPGRRALCVRRAMPGSLTHRRRNPARLNANY